MNALLTLQHDGHNSLDRIDERGLYILDKWKEELSDYSNSNPDCKIPKLTTVYVVAEYLRTHIEDMRRILNEYYNSQKNDNTK